MFNICFCFVFVFWQAVFWQAAGHMHMYVCNIFIIRFQTLSRLNLHMKVLSTPATDPLDLVGFFLRTSTNSHLYTGEFLFQHAFLFCRPVVFKRRVTAGLSSHRSRRVNANRIHHSSWFLYQNSLRPHSFPLSHH